MSNLSINGDPDYTEHVTQTFLNSLHWSRKRRKKWLRRNGLKLERNTDMDCCDDGANAIIYYTGGRYEHI